MDFVQVRLDELKAQLDRIEQAVSFVNIPYGKGGALVTVFYKDLPNVKWYTGPPWYKELYYWLCEVVRSLKEMRK